MSTNVDIESEFARIKKIKDLDWCDVRDKQNYELVHLNYPFGVRTAYKKIKQETYEDLQCSRGIQYDLDTPLSDVSLSVKLNEIDDVRISEIERLNETHHIFDPPREFFEFGFRYPKLLDYYAPRFSIARGCDVVSLNVELAKRAGYAVEKCDLNDPSTLTLDGVKFAVAYHVFEHTSDPLRTLSGIAEKMSSGAFLHVEIPIEDGLPRLRYAHMYAFQPRDLGHMLEIAGFKTLFETNTPNPGGPAIERALVVKP